MHKHLEREIEQLKAVFSQLSDKVEHTLHQTIEAFQTQNIQLAQQVIESDNDIDRLEILVEEECLKILALYQPVARDLRVVITFLKINSDLERIGDLAVNMARCTEFLAQSGALPSNGLFQEMMVKTQIMLKKSLESLVHLNTRLAYEVCLLDNEVDTLKRQLEKDITQSIQQDSSQTESLLRLLSIARYLERIGDHATNISEDVIYSIEGDIIRHHNIDRSDLA